MLLKNKDLLGMRELSREEILYILEIAKDMKKIVCSDNRKSSRLSGRSVLTLFYENSTRTRMSFELASKYLGANAANVPVSTSSVASNNPKQMLTAIGIKIWA